MPRPMWAGFVSAIILVSICAGVYAFTERAHIAEATLSEVDTIVGVDTDPTGNGATYVGSIDRCISVNPSDTFYIDLFVKDVTDLNSWEGIFSFDESVIDVDALDAAGFFLGSSIWPILDCYLGQCTVSNFDDTGAGHDGSGVLGRLQLTALSAGTSELYFTLWRPPFGVSGVYLRDAFSFDPEEPALPIGDLDGDDIFDGLVFNAIVVVGGPCPTDADLDGFTNVEESVDGSDLLDVDSTPEICDGADNDLDGVTDEWYDRAPANGTPDCVDAASDTDGDTVYNPDDTDDDDDDFLDAKEAYLATDSLADCAVNQYHSAWPLDINNDKAVTVVGDVLPFVGLIGSAYGDGDFRKRLDLSGEGVLTVVGDVLPFVGHVGETC